VNDFEIEKPQNKRKTWRVIVILVLLGLAVNLVLPKMMDIRHAIEVVREMTWWAVAMSVLAVGVVYLGDGYSLHALMDIHNHRLNIIEGAMISLASVSIGLVAGGWIGAAAATYRFVHKHGASKSSATIAGILPSMLVNAAIILVSVIGIIFLALSDRITQAQLIQYGVFLLILFVFTYGYLLALVFPTATYKAVNWALWNWARLRNRPYDPARTKQNVNSVIQAWKSLRGGSWFRPLLGAFVRILSNMASLYLIFFAAGYPLNLGVLFAGYGIPILIAKVAFIVPGGVGVIEASMAALFSSLGVPKEISIVAVIGYRLVSFWLPTFIGLSLSPFLTRSKAFQSDESPAN
jgi:uncharacterized protein (TIRG00374 family)